jgi:hypothetical protein
MRAGLCLPAGTPGPARKIPELEVVGRVGRPRIARLQNRRFTQKRPTPQPDLSASQCRRLLDQSSAASFVQLDHQRGAQARACIIATAPLAAEPDIRRSVCSQPEHQQRHAANPTTGLVAWVTTRANDRCATTTPAFATTTPAGAEAQEPFHRQRTLEPSLPPLRGCLLSWKPTPPALQQRPSRTQLLPYRCYVTKSNSKLEQY